ncbi:hypothetical protein E4T56_gene19084 [Termitomyces sp. T112]|nr:hypothetical protein E4T56_gene19084 [Termitomyces sp. T112]
MSFLSFLLLFSALASRVLANFSITVDLPKENVTLYTSQLLINFPDSMSSPCNVNCSITNQTLKACNDDPNCLCDVTNVAKFHDCEQCQFTQLVETNQKMEDLRVGSQAVLSGYTAICTNLTNVTLTASQTKLTLPEDWDGPLVAVLPVGGVVVAVGFTVILGVSALFILSNL